MAAIDGKYLSKEGLTYLWSQLKLKFATAAQGTKADTAVQTITVNNVARTKTNGTVNLLAYNTSGLGTTIPENADLNSSTYMTPGTYTCSSITVANSLKNTPLKGTAFRLEVKCLNNTNRVRQEFYLLSQSSGYYVRTYMADAWQAWTFWQPWDSVVTDQERQDSVITWSVNQGAKNPIRFDAIGTSASNSAPSYLYRGVRFTANQDGTILINRETDNTNNSIVYLYYRGSAMYIDDYCDGAHIFTAGVDVPTSNVYVMAGKLASGNSKMLQENEVITDRGSYTGIWVGIWISASYSPSNLILKPMIRPSIIEDATFEPYSPTTRELYENQIGLPIADGTDISELHNGKYFKDSNAGSLVNLPSDYSYSTAIIEVSSTIPTKRRVVLYPSTDASVCYVRTETSSGYGSWYKFQGTVVS